MLGQIPREIAIGSAHSAIQVAGPPRDSEWDRGCTRDGRGLSCAPHNYPEAHRVPHYCGTGLTQRLSLGPDFFGQGKEWPGPHGARRAATPSSANPTPTAAAAFRDQPIPSLAPLVIRLSWAMSQLVWPKRATRGTFRSACRPRLEPGGGGWSHGSRGRQPRREVSFSDTFASFSDASASRSRQAGEGLFLSVR
jgi:hypothetical protein